LNTQIKPYVDGGFPKTLATRTVLLDYVFPALDVVEIAARRETDVELVAKVFSGLGDSLNLRWLMRQVESLEVLGQWHARARANLRDELFMQHNHLVERILQAAGDEPDPVDAWVEINRNCVQRPMDMMHDMRNHAVMDYATIAVAVRSLAQLVNETA
jgi:glutamate dehydrogenase